MRSLALLLPVLLPSLPSETELPLDFLAGCPTSDEAAAAISAMISSMNVSRPAPLLGSAP